MATLRRQGLKGYRYGSHSCPEDYPAQAGLEGRIDRRATHERGTTLRRQGLKVCNSKPKGANEDYPVQAGLEEGTGPCASSWMRLPCAGRA